MRGKKRISLVEAERIGNILDVDWKQITVDQFRTGLEVEIVNYVKELASTGTRNDMMIPGMAALEQLKDFPEYYKHLVIMEKEADDYWSNV